MLFAWPQEWVMNKAIAYIWGKVFLDFVSSSTYKTLSSKIKMWLANLIYKWETEVADKVIDTIKTKWETEALKLLPPPSWMPTIKWTTNVKPIYSSPTWMATTEKSFLWEWIKAPWTSKTDFWIIKWQPAKETKLLKPWKTEDLIKNPITWEMIKKPSVKEWGYIKLPWKQDELKPLIEEAKKYKSFEEFKKSQWQELYHRTNATSTADSKHSGAWLPTNSSANSG